MAQKIRWGILGLGGIAEKFAEALSVTEDAQIVAAGSRSIEKAKAFGQKWKIPHCYGSYEELARDGHVDVIYIATPHSFHCENALLCLEHGKAVLVEKAFTANAVQAQQVIDKARQKKLFCMEAMWTRFLPMMVNLRQVLADGTIGEPQMATADFGFNGSDSKKERLLAPHLAGGALLDVGVYTLAFTSMIFGAPRRIATAAYLGNTGVDEQAGVVLGYEGQKMAMVTMSVSTNTPQQAVIMGSKGMITVHSQWYRGNAFTIKYGDGRQEKIEIDSHPNGFVYEIAQVHTHMRAGKIESPIMSLGETLAIMQTMDAIRAQWGLKYPFE